MKIQKPLEKNWAITQRFETRVSYMRSGIHSGIDYACPDDQPLPRQVPSDSTLKQSLWISMTEQRGSL